MTAVDRIHLGAWPKFDRPDLGVRIAVRFARRRRPGQGVGSAFQRVGIDGPDRPVDEVRHHPRSTADHQRCRQRKGEVQGFRRIDGGTDGKGRPLSENRDVGGAVVPEAGQESGPVGRRPRAAQRPQPDLDPGRPDRQQGAPRHQGLRECLAQLGPQIIVDEADLEGRLACLVHDVERGSDLRRQRPRDFRRETESGDEGPGLGTFRDPGQWILADGMPPSQMGCRRSRRDRGDVPARLHEFEGEVTHFRRQVAGQHGDDLVIRPGSVEQGGDQGIGPAAQGELPGLTDQGDLGL